MDKLTTKGIEITVQCLYQEANSFPHKEKFVFSYHVEIYNHSDKAVQLLNRHWVILDADNLRREVKGEGVIGLQPIIYPGQSHSYDSFTVLRTPLGKMYGTYGMIYLDTNEAFEVNIPAFKLAANFIYN